MLRFKKTIKSLHTTVPKKRRQEVFNQKDLDVLCYFKDYRDPSSGRKCFKNPFSPKI